MDQGNIPVNADEHEAKNGAIHVAVEESGHKSAQDLPKNPVIATEVVEDLEWQDQDQ